MEKPIVLPESVKAQIERVQKQQTFIQNQAKEEIQKLQQGINMSIQTLAACSNITTYTDVKFSEDGSEVIFTIPTEKKKVTRKPKE
jgi:hypothetical protein